MTETEIKEIVQKQRSYFYTGATLPVEKRLVQERIGVSPYLLLRYATLQAIRA